MPKAGEALRFTHLYLENWKNFIKVEADLPRRVVLAGPTASGKSNLLDALCFLHDLAAGGFQQAVQARHGVPRLRCLAARHHSEVTIAVRVGDDGSIPDWEYELQFTQENLRRPAIVRERITRAGEELLARPDDCDRADPERLTATALEHIHANRPFRELSTFFGSLRYVNAAAPLIRQPERASGRHSEPYGANLLEQIAAAAENVQHSRLKKIREALQLAVPHLEALELRPDTRGVPHLRARYGHWRALGAWQTEDQFSDGTLRFIALLWAALDGSGPLLAEEPELGLHPEVVRGLLPLLRGIQRRTDRQIFLTTHSKDLLSDEHLKPEEVLLLIPGEEGTRVTPAAALQDAPALLDGCFRTAESEIDEDQLMLFDDLPEES